MTIRALRKRAEYWQRRLNIPEWRITVRHSRLKHAVGQCWWSPEELRAEIDLRRGQGEETLVHEMLHIVIDGHTTYSDEKYSELHERAINRLAAALLNPGEE